MATIVFMGTPDFAIPSLEALIKHHTVVGVVTQPDRPAGRKGRITPPPIKIIAEENGIPVFQPERLRRKIAIETLGNWAHADLFVVAAFGQILPQSVLDMPEYGCINIHGSLLPRWRGAAPIHAAIKAGDTETGITIMQMDAGLDTGAMLRKRAIPITPEDTAQTMHDKLAQLGADLLIETLPDYLSATIEPQTQDDTHATYAPQIRKEDGQINWQDDAESIARLVRAYTPWPGTFTHWGDITLKIHAGNAQSTHQAPIAQVIQIGDAVAIGTGDGVFLPTALQMPGKKQVTMQEFINGYPDFMGALLR